MAGRYCDTGVSSPLRERYVMWTYIRNRFKTQVDCVIPWANASRRANDLLR